MKPSAKRTPPREPSPCSSDLRGDSVLCTMTCGSVSGRSGAAAGGAMRRLASEKARFSSSALIARLSTIGAARIFSVIAGISAMKLSARRYVA
jgi:hypothetical protein